MWRCTSVRSCAAAAGPGLSRVFGAQVVELMEAHRWATAALLGQDQERMLRIVMELRSGRLQRLGPPSPAVQRRVLVCLFWLPPAPRARPPSPVVPGLPRWGS